MLGSVLIHLSVVDDGIEKSLTRMINEWLGSFAPHPQLTYGLLNLLFWTIVAFVCHKKKWYLKV